MARGKVSNAQTTKFAAYSAKGAGIVRGYKLSGNAANNPAHRTVNGTATLCNVGLQRNAHLVASGWVWRKLAALPAGTNMCRTCAATHAKAAAQAKPARKPRAAACPGGALCTGGAACPGGAGHNGHAAAPVAASNAA